MEARNLLSDMYGPPRADTIPVYVKRIGDRDEVWKGVAEKTKGGLRKEDLMEKVVKVDKRSEKAYTKIVSVKASESAARNNNLSL